jgi:hypothetical protein
MKLHEQLGIDLICTTALNLLSSSLTMAIYANHDNNLRKFFILCHEEKIKPLHATTQAMIRYITWHRLHRIPLTILVLSQQVLSRPPSTSHRCVIVN